MVILGDCTQELKNILDKSIDLIVTSPPYKDCDDFSWGLMNDCFSECNRVLKDNSLIFINFGHLAEEKSRPLRLAIQLEDNFGLKLSETFIWKKNHYKPIQGERRVNNLTEFVFMFVKGKTPKLDRLSIGVPYADKSNIKRFNRGGDLKCRGNFWDIPYKTINSAKDKLHNDRFPIELPEYCIKLSGIKSGIVLDPFGGSGTTGLAAKNLGLDYILIEKNPIHFSTIQNRL